MYEEEGYYKRTARIYNHISVAHPDPLVRAEQQRQSGEAAPQPAPSVHVPESGSGMVPLVAIFVFLGALLHLQGVPILFTFGVFVLTLVCIYGPVSLLMLIVPLVSYFGFSYTVVVVVFFGALMSVCCLRSDVS